MPDRPWLLYGATGFTGHLTSVEAVRRGHQPILAGRSPEKLRQLAATLDLDYAVCELADGKQLRSLVADVDLVCHLAGPYRFTFTPMIRACMDVGTHYLDISGEISTLRAVRAYDSRAQRQEIAVIPAAGFVAVPTDCSARYAAERLSRPVRLETAVATEGGPSPGTVKTMLTGLPDGFVVRSGNQLVRQPIGKDTRRVTFMDGDRPAVGTPQADLVTGHLTTGIPEIRTYLGVPPGSGPLFQIFGPMVRKLASIPRLQELMKRQVDRFVHGPDEEMRRHARSQTWVRVVDEGGAAVEVWLETREAYQFTAHAVVRAAERILAEDPRGVLTPALAFGPDFPLEIPGTRRHVRSNV